MCLFQQTQRSTIQHVVVIENMPYDLYVDAECTDLVESLAEFVGQTSVTLYAKVRFTEE